MCNRRFPAIGEIARFDDRPRVSRWGISRFIKLLGGFAAIALVGISCQVLASAPRDLYSPALGIKMQTSAAAAVVGERARLLPPSTVLHGLLPNRNLPTAITVAAESNANAAHSDGAGVASCCAEDTRALENGWNLTPLNCRGVPKQASTKYITAPSPSPTPAARLGGPGRVPNQLPPFHKSAGGDPVLGDGEFFLQRLDASLAGAGIHYEFRRTYRSGLDNDGPFGSGWDHNYNQRIIGAAIYDENSHLSPQVYDNGVTPSIALTPGGAVVEVHKKSPGDDSLLYHVGSINGDTINWGPSRKYDEGVTPHISVTPDGVVVEAHKARAPDTLWYHVGRISGDTIIWGPSIPYDGGVTPSVALTPGGIVVEVHKKSPDDDSLLYHVGTISGDTINWGPSIPYDGGVTPSVAVNAAGIVIEVHKARAPDTLWYHVGRISGDTIIWGPSIPYDGGVTPSVAISPAGVVAEVHKSQGDDTLWYHVGSGVSGDAIIWNPSNPYDDGVTPSVAITPVGVFAEVHKYQSNDTLWSKLGLDWYFLFPGPRYHTGWAHQFDPTTIGDFIGTNCDGTVQFQDGEGSLQQFTKTGWQFIPGTNLPVEIFVPDSGDLRLEHMMIEPSTWALTRSDGTVSIFDRAGFLLLMKDLTGNTLTFEWERAAASPPPRLDCVAMGFDAPGCAKWLYSLTESPTGQRRRLARVKDASRTIYYVYAEQNPEDINPNNRLQCISLHNYCTQIATGLRVPPPPLATFNYDNASRLSSVTYGPIEAPPVESYKYHPVANPNEIPYCGVPSADLPNYCNRLCNPASGPSSCSNLNYDAQVRGRCARTYCEHIPKGELCDLPEPFSIVRRRPGKNPESICCSTTQNGTNDVCATFLFGGPTCVEGCEYTNQCQMIRNETEYAFYAGGLSKELNNDITDIYDSKGHLVVHNDYGEDRASVSFDKVTRQQISSASSDNSITFEYHDLAIERRSDGPPIYTDPADPSSPPHWPEPYSPPDSTGIVQRFLLSPDTVINLCPAICPRGEVFCGTVKDYDPATQTQGNEFADSMTWAVVIHDLHGLTRVQYLDQAFMLLREVTVETNEITDYNYASGLIRGIRSPSGVRTCNERDDRGRVTQSSVVPAAGYPGAASTQATTFAYVPAQVHRMWWSTGKLSDVVRDALGSPVRTHYERDEKSRVKWIDQYVRAGAAPLRTSYSYDGETPPAGILETPTQITYPNGRVDKFSLFDVSMGGPKSTVIDATNTTPEQRYAHYDSFGRVAEEGEVDRFAQRYLYNDSSDIWRLSGIGHRLDFTKPWIDTSIQSHLVDGETITDSIGEPTRTTVFTTVGRFPTQKDLEATSAPPGTTPPAIQTSCYNYSPDGRLEAAVLPEGNGAAYKYLYNSGGTTVLTNKGFGVDKSGAWAAGCRGQIAPPNDPGMGRPSERKFVPGGFVDRELDENQIARQFMTDGLGRIIQISSIPNPKHPDPMPVRQFGYDSAGHRIWEALRTPNTAYGRPNLPDSSVLSYSEHDYDLTGRVISERAFVVETGERLVKSYDYDYLRGTVTITDRGVSTTMAYDGRGRLVSTTLPDTSVATILHGLGSETAAVQSNSNGNIPRTFNYDTRGYLQNIRDAKNVVLYQASYDDDGNQLTESRAGQGQVTWTYDSFGRLVKNDKVLSTSPTTVTATSKYQYDRNDRLTAYFDAENSDGGNPWIMTFTGSDAPLTVTDPLLRVGTYSYPSSPNWPRTLVASTKEPNGRVTSFAYDSQARLINVYNGTCPATRNIWDCDGLHKSQRHLTYDARGNVGQIDAPNRATVRRNYDSIGRLVDDNVGVESTVHHTFLDAGRTVTTGVSYASASSFATMTHHYDNMGRLHTVELTGQTPPLATYDFGVGLGGPLTLTYSNGAKAAYSYDDKLRQTGIDVSFTKPGTTTTTPVASLHEAFGADSIPRMRQHQIGTESAGTDEFQVDSDGRVTCEKLLLKGITLPTGEIGNREVDPCRQQGTNWRQYDLDKIGNIKQQRMRNSTLVHEVDKLSRLTALGGLPVIHDTTDNLNGRLGGSAWFAFDQFTGTVVSAFSLAGVSIFEYDAGGRRRVEHRPGGTDRVFIWDGNRVVGHGTVNSLSLDVPGDDIDAHIASVDQFGSWFYHQGPDQSTLAVTGSAGLVEGYTYSAFGELSIWDAKGQSQSQSAFGNIFQYQGQVYDALTATSSMRARQYRPTWGSFLSPDPIAIAGGPSLYAFAGSRPLQSRDPLGLLGATVDRDPTILEGSCEGQCEFLGVETLQSDAGPGLEFRPYPEPTSQEHDPWNDYKNYGPGILGRSGAGGGPGRGDVRGRGDVFRAALRLPAPPPPAPPASLRGKVGSLDYYKARNTDFLRRHPNQKPPSYYLRYGDKYAHRFTLQLRPFLSLYGKIWADATLRNLQIALENLRDLSPTVFDILEQRDETFTRFAYSTHPEAYLGAGLAQLPLTDILLIGLTPDVKDSFSVSAIEQVISTAQKYVPEFILLRQDPQIKERQDTSIEALIIIGAVNSGLWP